uniref:GAF domain-containing protein n=1 Tax=Daejeonella sp. TaxID=2805397 RepID=UPI003982E858
MTNDKLPSESLESRIKQLSVQLDQRTEELAVINSVQEALAIKMEMQEIYDLVGDRIRDMFDAQALIIATFEEDVAVENFKYAIENGERFYLESRPLDKLRQHLITTRQKIVLNTREEALEWFGKSALPGTKILISGVFVPLIMADKITGYISLQNVDKENAFSENNISLLETLANSMGVALENARLFDETARLLKETEQGKAELAVINSVQEGLVREMDIQGIYNLVGNRIRDLFNAQVVIIATFDLANNLEYFNYHIEKGEISYPKPRNFDKVREHLIQTGQNILINENVGKAIAEFGLRVLPGTEVSKSLLFMPMKVGDRVTGYVSLQNIDQENAFSFSDVRLLSTLSNSMSVALQNAKLFD